MCTVLLPQGVNPSAVNKYIIYYISYRIIYHVMSCHVMSCHVMSCHVMSCHVMSCHVMSCHVIYHIISYRIVLYRIISSYHIITYIISYHITSYHAISYWEDISFVGIKMDKKILYYFVWKINEIQSRIIKILILILNNIAAYDSLKMAKNSGRNMLQI